jgi:hypothetical protein
MTYSAGSLIVASDFNTFRTQVNDVIADNFSNSAVESSANFGYGFGDVTGPVSSGGIITAAQWTSLLNRITAAAQHQGTGISVPASVSVGSTVSILSGLSSSITSIRNNRLNIAAGNATITSGGTRLNTTRTASWATQVAHEWNVSFANYNFARYFFNSGGQIRMSASRTGGSAITRNTDWSNLLSGMGTIIFDHTNTTTTGSGNTSSIGFYNLTTSFQTIFQRFGTGAYTTNNYTLRARLFNPLGSSANTIRFRAEFNSDGFTDGSLRHNVDERRATGPSVSQPAPTYVNALLLTSGY